MKVLVTGSTGFIGKWIMNELNCSDYKVIAFSGDVRDKRTFPNDSFDAIIHLAALITHRKRYTFQDLYEVNVEGTRNLCEVYSTAKMIYISTNDVTRVEPLSDYAKTKLEAEKVVEKHKSYAIIRLPSVFGPNQRQAKLIPLLFRKYLENEECTIFNNDLREYIFVETLAKRIVENIAQTGIITMKGVKIRNFDLDIMIGAVCHGEEIHNLTSEEQEFFSNLKKCLPKKGEIYEN
jgi:nucleoside-diphosphate-sugar epimerase